MSSKPHPRTILLGAQGAGHVLPVVDHYSGVPARMRKSLELQAQLIREFGACVMDVTLDCEDGAPAGQEVEHAEAIVDLLAEMHEQDAALPLRAARRVGLRVHAVEHPAFYGDLQIVLQQVGQLLAFVMVPKVDTLADVEKAVATLDALQAPEMPLHVLIESPLAVHNAFAIAAHPRVQSLSFGVMDFVSSHNGAIPATAMSVQGQFTHPQVLRAKLEMAAACHAFGKVPSHCVVTEFTDAAALQAAARTAARELGYTRMWSIHPAQVRPILAAFAPQADEVSQAAAIIQAAQAADWGPISHDGVLHDRASYRYYWQLLEKAHATGVALPESVKALF